MRNRYQRRSRKSMGSELIGRGRRGKFEIVAGRELEVRLPLPLVEMWEELQAEVERLAGEAGLRILRAILDDEVRQRVGPPAGLRGVRRAEDRDRAATSADTRGPRSGT